MSEMPVNLSFSELESYREQGSGRRSGQYERYYCPIHGGDQQRSLALKPENGHFKCHQCGAWGYLEEFKEGWIREKKREHFVPRQRLQNRSRPSPSQPMPKLQPRVSLKPLVDKFQQALPGSLGEKYLEYRKIPLAVAQSCGVGYAKENTWPHVNAQEQPVRQWKWGRLVFPHSDNQAEVVNLYGRAVGKNERVPKSLRHDHLPGAKGIFNAQALSKNMVFVCEGVFDALSMMAAGYEACAIFGLDGLRWEWVAAKQVVFAFDQDIAGQKWKNMAYEGLLRDKEIYWLPPESFGGCKDVNEAWSAGLLKINFDFSNSSEAVIANQISQSQDICNSPEKALNKQLSNLQELLALQEKLGYNHPVVLRESRRLGKILNGENGLWEQVWQGSLAD